MVHAGPTFFHSSPEPTIGVESELFIVDHEHLDLTNGAPDILTHFSDDSTVKPELLESIIEINTGICREIGAVRRDLRRQIAKVIEVAESRGMRLLSTGTHPFARWSDANVTRNQRYQDFLQRMQFPVRRLLISGLHVHVGVESGEKAIAIVNALLRYVPHFIGLSANSPYWDGEHTGLASTRTQVFEGMPTAGLPPRLTNYSEFQRLMRTLQRAHAIESIREVWWDIRPHPGFGTVEIRLFDAVPTVEQMVQLAAFAQCLVVALSDYYDNGQQLPLLSDWVVRENKWRAVRSGLDAEIIMDDDGRLQTLRSSIQDVLEKLAPVANRLDCGPEMEQIAQIVADGEPGKLQLQRAADSGDLSAVILGAIADLKTGL